LSKIERVEYDKLFESNTEWVVITDQTVGLIRLSLQCDYSATGQR